jgi:hypothetical protein
MNYERMEAIYCDSGSGPQYCGGEDHATPHPFTQVGPTSYISDVTVLPNSVSITDAGDEDVLTNIGIYGISVLLAVSDGTYTVSVAPVPEAATWALMIGGFAMVGAGMRRVRIGVRMRMPDPQAG